MSRSPTLRLWLYRSGAVAIALVVTFAILEVGTRLVVPESTFRVLSDVFEQHPSPAIGYTLRRSFESNAFGARLSTNSFGFRGPEWPRLKPPNTTRIALVGDSHTFGFGVDAARTWGELLRGRLQARLGRNVEVLNFGVNGYNSRQQAAVLEELALPLAPDLVIIQVSSNDHEAALTVDADGFLHTGVKSRPDDVDIWRDRHQEAFTAFERRTFSSSRFLTYVRILSLRRSMRQAAASTEAADLAATASVSSDPTTGPVAEELRETVYEPLTRMVRSARRRGAAVAFVTFAAPLPWRQTIGALAAREAVPTLDLIAALDARTWKELVETWSLGWDSHMGPAAHAVWAERIDALLSGPDLSRALLHPGFR